MSIELEVRVLKRNELMVELRKQKGLTQAEVARRCGIVPPYISQIETLNCWPSAPIQKRVAEVLGVAPDVLFPEEMRQAVGRTLSRKTRVTAEAVAQFAERWEGMETSRMLPDSGVIADEEKALMAEALDALTPREMKVVTDYYGFGDGEKTLKDIASEIGVKTERVRQIRNRALGKMRHKMKSNEALDD